MRKYESVFILPSSMDDKGIAKVVEHIKGVISENGGESIEIKEPHKKRFSYPINKMTEGFYVEINFDMESTNLQKIKDSLKHYPDLVRYIIVKKEE